MASYHLSVKTVSRASGRSAVAAAAYRTAERLTNERDGLTHDYKRRAGVEETFIVAPAGAEWAQDRAALWNAVEAAERRKDAKVAREYEIALPHELDAAGRRGLAEGFARAVVERFGVAADVAIHAPGREGDQRNWHAHVLTTTRRVEADGLGAKTRELDVVQTSGPAVEALRELWAVQINHALERISIEARVDHRSHERRGLDLAPTQHLGPAAAGIERKAGREERRRQDQEREGQIPASVLPAAAIAAGEAPGPAPVPAPRAPTAAAAEAEAPGADPARRPEEPPQLGAESRTLLRAISVVLDARQEPGAAAELRAYATRALAERERTRGSAGPAPGEAPRPASPPFPGQDARDSAKFGAGRVPAPEGVSDYPLSAQAALGPSAGVSGAGAEPATRIGRRNAEVRERNRVREALRAAWEEARRVVERLERARRLVVALARGRGAEVVAEREERAREAERQRVARELARQERERRAEQERQERERRLELERQAQERRLAEERRPELARRITQEQRDLARQRQRTLTPEQEAARRQEAEQAQRRQAQEREVVRYRGPSLGM